MKNQQLKYKEPAYKSYFFSPIYKSVWSIIKSAYGNVRRFIFQKFFGQWMSALSKNFFLWPVLIAGSVLGIITFVFTYIIITGLLLVFFAIIVAVDIIVLLFCGLIRFIDMLIRWINGIWTVCYSCQKKIINAVYTCPTCGAVHKKLYPGKYGILRRRCSCGTVLSTTFGGRRKLPSKCPYCNADCQSDTAQISIPVLGGPSGGKTHIINSGLDEVRIFAEQNPEYLFSYWKDEDKRRHELCLSVFHKRPMLDKTTVDKFDAYKFYFSKRKATFKNLVYIYDIAGEAVVDERRLGGNEAMKYCKSFLFVLDPLSLPDFAMQFKKENGKQDDYAPCGSYIDDVLSTVLNTLNNALGISDTKLKDANVAVVITKSDIPKVQEELGDTKVSDCIRQNKGIGYNEAVNILCEGFLQKYNAGNFRDFVKMKFKQCQFFVANTWNSEKKMYEPHNTADPFLWLIDMESPKINLKSRWNRKI